MSEINLHRQNDGYVSISNVAAKDSSLSFKAKGMLLTLFSLPPTWNFSVKGIASIAKESKDTVNRIIHELEDAGYAKRTLIKDSCGKFVKTIYDFYDTPCLKNPYPENADTENADTENPFMENKDANIIFNKSNIQGLNLQGLNNQEITPYSPPMMSGLSNDMEQAILAWNALGISKVTKIPQNSDRYKQLKKRIEEYGIDEVLRAIQVVGRSDFLNGTNDKGWNATFDWLVKPNNFLKVIEGNYDRSSKASGGYMTKTERAQREMEAAYDVTEQWLRSHQNDVE